MKERLDVLLVNRSLAPSRERAKALIMEGNVFVDGQREDKAGAFFPDTVAIEVRGNALPYVSRGGLKLAKALDEFGLSPKGAVCMDVGASTGGFTDCMLQRGAAKVYAVDVGYGQFAWKLRQDPRVICLEKTNIRYVTTREIADPIAFAAADVSFISLTKVLMPVGALLTEGADLVCLIKPQFEAGRENVGKKGVVRDENVHRGVVEKVASFACEHGYRVRHLTFSPVKGPEGNIEYLIHLQRQSSRAAAAPDGGGSEGGAEEQEDGAIDVRAVIAAAHEALG